MRTSRRSLGLSKKKVLGDSYYGKPKKRGSRLPAKKEGKESPGKKRVVPSSRRDVSSVEVDGVEYVNH
jgi:hypothetical protein